MANFETIKLDKGLYSTNKGFLAELESIDPSENYKGTSLEGLDAFERQLKRFDIKVSGENSDPIEKFFSVLDSAALFPEYISRAVRSGVKSANFLPDIIATKITTSSPFYTGIVSTPKVDAMNALAEGEAFPETKIDLSETSITLKKYGRLLCASYESIRSQRIDLFTIFLRQIGACIANAQLKDALTIIVDGNEYGKPSPIEKVAKSGELTYSDLVDFWNKFDPFQLNTIVAAPNIAATILKMPEMRDAAAGLSFHANGKIVTPLGAKFFKDSTVKAGTLIGLDKSSTLEMIQNGELATEYDKLIDRQLERATVFQTVGFAKLFNDSSKVLSTLA